LLRSTKFHPHINKTTKSAAVAQAESIFIANPKKNRPEDMSGAELIGRRDTTG